MITKAKSKGIPVIQVGGGGVPLGTFNGNYGPNEAKAGELLTEALFEKLDALEEEPVEINIHNFPAKWGAERTEQLEKAVEGQSKIKVNQEVVTDAANLVPYTRNTVTTQITQNPDVKAYWFTFDTDRPGRRSGRSSRNTRVKNSRTSRSSPPSTVTSRRCS